MLLRRDVPRDEPEYIDADGRAYSAAAWAERDEVRALLATDAVTGGPPAGEEAAPGDAARCA